MFCDILIKTKDFRYVLLKRMTISTTYFLPNSKPNRTKISFYSSVILHYLYTNFDCRISQFFISSSNIRYKVFVKFPCRQFSMYCNSLDFTIWPLKHKPVKSEKRWFISYYLVYSPFAFTWHRTLKALVINCFIYKNVNSTSKKIKFMTGDAASF